MIFLSDFMRIDDEEFMWQYELIKSSLNLLKFNNVIFLDLLRKQLNLFN